MQELDEKLNSINEYNFNLLFLGTKDKYLNITHRNDMELVKTRIQYMLL